VGVANRPVGEQCVGLFEEFNGITKKKKIDLESPFSGPSSAARRRARGGEGGGGGGGPRHKR
jgi:hypothetical protein